jgi:hypothetical protein
MTTTAFHATDHRDPLTIATAAFVAGLLVHGADHLRRGFDVLTPEVFWAGTFQLVMSAVVVVLVVRRSEHAPLFACALGFLSALGFGLAHLLPDWGAFSDAFTGAHRAAGVTWFSWVGALAEIVTGLWMGAAGLMAMRRTGVV